VPLFSAASSPSAVKTHVHPLEGDKMSNGPAPHGDFIITEEGAGYSGADEGTHRPIGEDEAERAHQSRSETPAERGAEGEATEETSEPAAIPLSVYFNAQEKGR
jgi:hypothetical protein